MFIFITTITWPLRRPQKLTKSSLSIWHYVVSVKSTVKISLIFVAFLENTNFTNCAKLLSVKFFCVTVNFIIEKLKFCKITQLFLVSVPLVRGKYEEMRENKKHIFRAWNPTTVIPLLKAKNVFNGIWYQTLRRTSLVQCGRIPRQK